jgi:hypothetical protein
MFNDDEMTMDKRRIAFTSPKSALLLTAGYLEKTGGYPAQR